MRPESRASAYPAGSETSSVIATTTAPTSTVFPIQRRYWVSSKRNLTLSSVGEPWLKEKGTLSTL